MSLLVLGLAAAACSAAGSSCSVTEFGAVAGNRSSDARRNADALQLALASCELVRIPPGTFKLLPVTLPSHRVLFLDAGASLVGSEVWQDYGSTLFLPPMGTQQQLRPLLSATNATNVTITGLNGTIDGNGWFAWPAANWSDPEWLPPGAAKKPPGGLEHFRLCQYGRAPPESPSQHELLHGGC